MTNKNFYRTMSRDYHHLALKILIKAFTAYMNVLRNYMVFHCTRSREFKDLLSTLDTLSNARMTHQIIDLVTVEKYLRTISHNLKTSPNWQLVFRHTDS